jgi:hypothetical protein
MTLSVRTAVHVLVCLICAGCGASDYIESRYDDLSAAQAAGAVERGWIPPFFPSSATAIREPHNIDTNEVWATFTASRDALDDAGECAQSARGEVALPRKAGLGWWPEALSEGAEETTASQYMFYRCGAAAFIAADGTEPRFFYWRRSN